MSKRRALLALLQRVPIAMDARNGFWWGTKQAGPVWVGLVRHRLLHQPAGRQGQQLRADAPLSVQARLARADKGDGLRLLPRRVCARAHARVCACACARACACACACACLHGCVHSCMCGASVFLSKADQRAPPVFTHAFVFLNCTPKVLLK